ncbi:hypothetical protein DGG96_03640 [Legionella qingyii]|uniref:Uncharacterized protein n=1 Tax=Legionella qingyii TaxID=2184757 RepID=A0A317U662_9GAMM|nr:hypothetical protein [Legionella qingyii]PWY57091.1 hypothetical protein DGG96_03640 [Legionella qingyii]
MAVTEVVVIYFTGFCRLAVFLEQQSEEKMIIRHGIFVVVSGYFLARSDIHKPTHVVHSLISHLLVIINKVFLVMRDTLLRGITVDVAKLNRFGHVAVVL